MPDVTALVAGDPTRIGRYRPIARLRETARGVVYLAEPVPRAAPAEQQGQGARGQEAQDRDGGRLVVVRTLPARLVAEPAVRERVSTEIAAARRIPRGATAALLDVDLDAAPPFVVTELVDGTSLQQEVTASGPLSGHGLDRLALGTATALAAVHRAGVVHRCRRPDSRPRGKHLWGIHVRGSRHRHSWHRHSWHRHGA